MVQDRALRGRFYNTLLKAAEWASPWELPLTKIKETNILLALRAVANGLQEGTRGDEPWLGQVHCLEYCADYPVLNTWTDFTDIPSTVCLNVKNSTTSVSFVDFQVSHAIVIILGTL
jgi:hypothetical protein